MADIYTYRHLVQEEEIDELGHANNVAYLTWTQRAAVAHSAEQGWPMDRYRAGQVAWVVRSHAIKYLEPAVAGEQLEIRTWVADMLRIASHRCYDIRRRGKTIARAKTLWVFVDTDTGRAVRVPAELRDSFTIVETENWV